MYQGTVRHRRHEAADHAFAYDITLVHLDLDEVDLVAGLHPLWSHGRANVASFRREDHLGDPAVPLGDAVRDLVFDRSGVWPRGPVSLLTQVRLWGWLFNPISVYFCWDEAGERVEAVVLEVTNTPWHERHAYVVVGGPGEHWFDKELHVSPFFGMDHRYRLRFTAPGDTLVVQIQNQRDGRMVFDATLTLRRRAVSRAALGRIVWRRPLQTLLVSARIRLHALRLWAKGVPVHRHPGRDRAGVGSGR